MTSFVSIGDKTKLASAVSSALSPRRTAMLSALVAGVLAAPQASYAQADASAQLEEVVVTGYRNSLARAADVKRNASGVVDAISAQDIGVFPDTNLAESLQRITGVSIDRSRGEGSKVTVRGFGPAFNLVTLNGRQMPTHDGDNRSFDFADIASEGIAGVQVYKTGDASVATGGIGATINIQTTRPLDAPGLKSVMTLKAVHDTSTTSGDDLTPELSGIYSNTFADDTIGVAISGSYQKRDNGVNTATVGDYNNFAGTVDQDWGAGTAQWGGLPRDDNQINRPADSDIYAVPQSIGYELAEFSRERLNGQLTVQWRPTDNVTTTVDYTYSEVDYERTFSNYSGWFNFGGVQSEYSDGPIASPLVYTEFGVAPDFAMAAGRDGVKTENNSLGFNVDWQVTDRLTVEFDAHSSEAQSGASGNNGTASQLAIASFTRDRTSGIFGGDLPILNLGLSGPLDPNDLIVTGSVFDNKATKMEIQQVAANATFDLNDTSAINFGVQLSEVDNRSQFSNVQRDTWGGTTQPGDIADLVTPASAAGAFDQISNGDDPRRQSDFFVFDIDELAARTEALGATQSTGGDCGTGLCPSSTFTTDRITNEESTALYVQIDLDRELGAIPVNIKAGIRYEETDVESLALVPTYTSVVQQSDNEFSAIQAVDASGAAIQDFTRLTGSYDYLLPNLDIKFDLTDNVVARISYSESITRPGYRDIQGGLTIEQLIRVSGGNGNRGNPNLLPFESQNIDLSLEYYFGDADYASVGYYSKDVENFIGTSIVQDEVLFANLIHPATGAPVTFDVTVPVNQEDASIDGWEFAVQKAFGDSGFGVIANATVVDSDVAYDNLSLESQFVLTGLSDSANLVGFYENDKFQVRLAYNWRDDFYNGIAGAAAGTPGPVNFESFGQWDLSARYHVSDNLTVFVEGLNITEETVRTYGRSELQVIQAYQTGARYNFGVRYAF
ncbi:TonB-dependent receptor [Arenicella xantha]|uniref:TonB-dependent receptor n=1 Tax=Arenicella xantha TaxID=644221 RepID=A0A395JIF8_9GAMM|nr:TonB-dependent receptor [Arenicella xantha]RBP48727.1 TonB-dependent receptor [Arenicella xantha]